MGACLRFQVVVKSSGQLRRVIPQPPDISNCRAEKCTKIFLNYERQLQDAWERGRLARIFLKHAGESPRQPAGRQVQMSRHNVSKRRWSAQRVTGGGGVGTSATVVITVKIKAG